MGDIINMTDYSNEDSNNQHTERNRRNTKLWIFLLVAIIVMQSVLLITEVQLGKKEEEKAYVTAVIIDLLEDQLLLKHGAFPDDVGLAEVRDAWIDNPSEETAEAYYQSLKSVLESLEKKPLKEEVVFSGQQVQF